jgi:hypothetical protein
MSAYHQVIQNLRVVSRKQPNELKCPGKTLSSNVICSQSREVLSAVIDVAAIRRENAADDIKKRGLSCAVWPNQGLYVTALNPKTDIMERSQAREAFGYIVYPK